MEIYKDYVLAASAARSKSAGSGAEPQLIDGLPRGARKTDDFCSHPFFSAPPGARTLDPNIKSVVLYQLS